MASKLVALVLLAVTFAEAKVSFRGHKLLEVPLFTRAQAEVVHELEQMGIDVWTAVIGKEAHLHVAPEHIKMVNQTLMNAGMMPRVAVKDLQQLIDEETVENAIAENEARDQGRAAWVGTAFVRYSEIVAWIQALPSTCGGKCAIQNIGKSYENRDIYVIRISNNIAQSGSRKVFFFEANIHAREWLAHASTAYIVEKLLSGYGTNSRITKALDTYEWHFVVMANPDGYEYTHTTDRLWRKTRSVQGRCFGVDPNRNFDDHHCGEGTSTSPCSDTYCGPSPFSEKETQVIRDYTTPLASRIVVFHSIHAYSQLLLLPWAYTTGAYPSDFAELTRVANLLTDAIRANSGKIYVAGNIADLLYPAAGSTVDWARSKLKTLYPMAWEVRPNQNAANGFIVAPSEIAPTGEELLAAFLTLSENVKV
jgi:murein tripeptide amidase MpaA